MKNLHHIDSDNSASFVFQFGEIGKVFEEAAKEAVEKAPEVAQETGELAGEILTGDKEKGKKSGELAKKTTEQSIEAAAEAFDIFFGEEKKKQEEKKKEEPSTQSPSDSTQTSPTTPPVKTSSDSTQTQPTTSTESNETVFTFDDIWNDLLAGEGAVSKSELQVIKDYVADHDYEATKAEVVQRLSDMNDAEYVKFNDRCVDTIWAMPQEEYEKFLDFFDQPDVKKDWAVNGAWGQDGIKDYTKEEFADMIRENDKSVDIAMSLVTSLIQTMA